MLRWAACGGTPGAFPRWFPSSVHVIGRPIPSARWWGPAPSGGMVRAVRRWRGACSSPWPKSIHGLCPLENLWFSRELRSRHLIHEVRQAVWPQPASSPCPKSIHGLCPLENLWFSRELRSRHLIHEVRQAVWPQPAGSPWTKSIRGLWPPKTLRFSREPRSRHLIHEVRQAVWPQPANRCPAISSSSLATNSTAARQRSTAFDGFDPARDSAWKGPKRCLPPNLGPPNLGRMSDVRAGVGPRRLPPVPTTGGRLFRFLVGIDSL